MTKLVRPFSRLRFYQRINRTKLFGCLLITAAMVIYFIFKTPSVLIVSVICDVLGIILVIAPIIIEKKWWNSLDLYEKCDYMASDLYLQKRGWYLNPLPGDNYLFVPLKKSNMNEFGGGKHISTTKDEVIRLLKEKKIVNLEMAELTIEHFSRIL